MEGNVLLGPSSAAVPDRLDAATTREVTERLKAEALALVPGLAGIPAICTAGLRPKLVDPRGGSGIADFVIEESAVHPGWINLLGIESRLTAAPAIARLVAEMIGAPGGPEGKAERIPGRRLPPASPASTTPTQRRIPPGAR